MDAQTEDGCWKVFNASSRLMALNVGRGARVLEIGCAEANWLTPMSAARPDVLLTGIDSRACERPGAAVIQGDVLTHNFEPDFFNFIILVSTLEHIGLGYYGDPLREDGDRLCLERVHGWLKPGGILYFDVPFYRNYHVTERKDGRVYDDATLTRFRDEIGFVEAARHYTRLNEDPVPMWDHPPFVTGPERLQGCPLEVVICWWCKRGTQQRQST